MPRRGQAPRKGHPQAPPWPPGEWSVGSAPGRLPGEELRAAILVAFHLRGEVRTSRNSCARGAESLDDLVCRHPPAKLPVDVLAPNSARRYRYREYENG